MSTFTKIVYHLVFSTKNREKTLKKENRQELFKYMTGLLKHKNCFVYSINGVEEHLHILFELHQSIALADLVKDIKLSTSKMIKEKNLFPDFDGWQIGYGAFSVCYNHINVLIEYIKNQEEHHKRISFIDEYKKFLDEYGIKYDEKYLE